MNAHQGAFGRRSFRLVVVAVAVALSLAACGSSDEASSGAPKELRVAYIPITNGNPIVQSNGWLEDALKIGVKWKEFPDGGSVNTAMAGGSADVGVIGSVPAAIGIMQGLKYKVVWIFDVIGDNEALVVRKEANIKSLEDLKGKKVATAFGSTMHYSLISALKEANIDPKAIRLLDMPPADALAAWKQGSIDAAYMFQPTLAKMKEDNGTVLLSSAKLAEQGIITADVGIVSADFAKKYPSVVEEWLKQQERAMQMIRSNPDEAVSAVAKSMALPQDVVKSQIEEVGLPTAKEQSEPRYFGSSASPGALADVLFKTAQFLYEQKVVSSKPDKKAFKDAVDASFLDELAK